MAVDRIKDLQRQAEEAEQARKRALEEKANRAAEEARLSEIEAQKREELARQRVEERRQLIRNVTNRVLQESGALVELADIESRLLQGVERHRIIVDLDNANARLVWGNRLDISPQGAISRRPFLFGLLGVDPILDYSYINVSVNVDSLSLDINGQTFSPVEWREKPKIVEALAHAYINPKRVTEDHTPAKYSGGGDSSYSRECCCS